ncbi:MAG: hypothetical protein ACXAEN_18760 [Candidatus Thorarchaeota archaeon]
MTIHLHIVKDRGFITFGLDYWMTLGLLKVFIQFGICEKLVERFRIMKLEKLELKLWH